MAEKNNQVNAAVMKRRKRMCSQVTMREPSNCERRAKQVKPGKWPQHELEECHRNHPHS